MKARKYKPSILDIVYICFGLGLILAGLVTWHYLMVLVGLLPLLIVCVANWEYSNDL